MNVIAKIPREHHRTVLGIKGMNVQRIEAMASVQITFPSKELGSEDVVINGPETQCQHAKQLLKVGCEVGREQQPESHHLLPIIFFRN